jgi:hypothetical protein
MPLVLNSKAQYLTREVPSMRGDDYDATHLVKAVKGLPLNPNSYTSVIANGRWTRITEANKDPAMDWFAEWAAQKIDELGPRPKVIVPVPSSKTIVQSPATFRTAILAQKVAALAKNAVSFPGLRFQTAQPNSREEGGSRSAEVLYPLLRLQRLPPGDIVLLDDVVTGGGHLRAASWLIEDQGRRVQHAICCGRSLETQLDDPFSVPLETIDTRRAS